jgi:hypothetical protein
MMDEIRSEISIGLITTTSNLQSEVWVLETTLKPEARWIKYQLVLTGLVVGPILYAFYYLGRTVTYKY